MKFFWCQLLLATWSILVSRVAAIADALPSVVMGVDLGTESARVGFFSLPRGELIASEAVSYETYFPAPGHAEQDPSKWVRYRLYIILVHQRLSILSPSTI